MIAEEDKLHYPCPNESFGHFRGIEEKYLSLASQEDIFPFPPDHQQSPTVCQVDSLWVAETRENPTNSVVHVRDNGNHNRDPKDWVLNGYHRIELTLDRNNNNTLPIKVDNESWCKGNCKREAKQLNTPYLVLSVYLTANTDFVKPCSEPKCPSRKVGRCVQVTSSSQVLDAKEDQTFQFKVKVLCIPFHQRKIESFSLLFVIKDSDGIDIGSAVLDIGRPKANRSKNRLGFPKPPLVSVLVLIIRTVHYTFRATRRIQQ
jgi:hypothetical protein